MSSSAYILFESFSYLSGPDYISFKFFKKNLSESN